MLVLSHDAYRDTWTVENNETGEPVAWGLTEDEALAFIIERSPLSLVARA